MAIGMGLGIKQAATNAFFPLSPLHLPFFLRHSFLPFRLHVLATDIPRSSAFSSFGTSSVNIMSWPCLLRNGYGRVQMSGRQDIIAISSWNAAPCKSRSVVAAASAETLVTKKERPSAGNSSAIEKKDSDGPDRTSWRPSIDFKWIRDNKDAMAANVINRKTAADVEKVVQLYEQSCHLRGEVDKLRAERNAVANAMKGKVEASKREELIEQGQRIPNTTHPSVPIGPEENAVVRKQVGVKREFTFPVKDHMELGLALDLFDFEAAAEVSGNKFYYLKNEAVLLELALINWSVAQLTRKGFVPLSTPDIVRSNVVEKCGFQPRGQNTQIYSIEGTDLCLAGTAEIPVGGLYMDQIVSNSVLPLKLVAFSHCFRTEAGAAGSATRGLYRVHQFSKVEMFIICCPEHSEAFHEELISIEEELFDSLGLHFKILDMATEDLGAPAHRKFDIEAWMPGLDRYGEISSASNCTDYQSRRLNIRYRPVSEALAVKKVKGSLPPLQFVHTLNATACAVPRMIISILENYQQEDGSIIIPEVLQPYMGGLGFIRARKL
ncbi:hypothetical protein O6H91_20G073000 [Diphasiastrum complanatum]|uniref:Uncharacterized protein n=1 Tax=Diphasiastrum complanatum TaxID=34168 RepID=A0ACC2ARQ6_DIPCM|nr:hypothetical protein O6H91_20G073000 [Diphasiastrum complanatum]